MLHLSGNQRYYLYQGHADMRKGFDSLSGLVTTLMENNALNGDIYIFFNRRRNQVKLLTLGKYLLKVSYGNKKIM